MCRMSAATTTGPVAHAWSPWCAGPSRSQEKGRCQLRIFGGRSSAKNQMTLGDQLGQCRRAWNRRYGRQADLLLDPCRERPACPGCSRPATCATDRSKGRLRRGRWRDHHPGPAPLSGRPGHRTGREVLTHVDAPGAERFGDILLRVYWLSDWLLSQRLKELEAEGLVTRTVVPATPVQSRHARSGRGRDLIVALQPLVKWGNAATH